MKPVRVLMVILLLGLPRCAAQFERVATQPPSVGVDPSPGTGVGVFFGANRQGETDPCGCQINQYGGLERLAGFVQSTRKGNREKTFLMVDSGDTFFSAPKLNQRRHAEALAKAKAIAESYQLIGTDFLTPGERDFALGTAVLKDLERLSGATFVASNLMNSEGNPLFAEHQVWSGSGMRIGIFGLADPDAFAGLPEVKVAAWKPAADAQVKKLRQAGVDVIVCLSHLGLTLDRELAKLGKIDLIVGAHSQDVTSTPVVEGGAVIVQPHPQGHQIGQLTLHTGTERVRDFRLVDLDQRFDGKNSVTPVLANLAKRLAASVSSQGSAANDLPANQPGGPPFVAHAMSCRSCHQAQHDFWAKTKHSSAYLVLYSKLQHFNPECIACHSLGFEQPGGFSSITRPVDVKGANTEKSVFIESWMKKVFGEEVKKGPLDSRSQPERHQKLHKNYHRELRALERAGKVNKWFIGVQCEHCHGNRDGHPGNGVRVSRPVSEQACLQCHIAPNAPTFDPTSIKLVACPRMKKGE